MQDFKQPRWPYRIKLETISQRQSWPILYGFMKGKYSVWGWFPSSASLLSSPMWRSWSIGLVFHQSWEDTRLDSPQDLIHGKSSYFKNICCRTSGCEMVQMILVICSGVTLTPLGLRTGFRSLRLMISHCAQKKL